MLSTTSQPRVAASSSSLRQYTRPDAQRPHMADHKVEPRAVAVQDEPPSSAPPLTTSANATDQNDHASSSAPSSSDNVNVRKTCLEAVIKYQKQRISELEALKKKKLAKIESLSAPNPHLSASPIMMPPTPSQPAVTQAAASQTANTPTNPFPPPPTVTAATPHHPHPPMHNPAIAAAMAAAAAAATPTVSPPLPAPYPFLFPHPDHPAVAASLMGVMPPPQPHPPPPPPQPTQQPPSSQPSQSNDAADRRQSRYWTADEHQRFLAAVHAVGPKNYVQISEFVGTRNAKQVRTHAQKFQKKLEREKAKLQTSIRLAGVEPAKPSIDAAAAAAAAVVTMQGAHPGPVQVPFRGPAAKGGPSRRVAVPTAPATGKRIPTKDPKSLSSGDRSSSTNTTGEQVSDPNVDPAESRDVAAAAAAVVAEAVALGGGLFPAGAMQAMPVMPPFVRKNLEQAEMRKQKDKAVVTPNGQSPAKAASKNPSDSAQNRILAKQPAKIAPAKPMGVPKGTSPAIVRQSPKAAKVHGVGKPVAIKPTPILANTQAPAAVTKAAPARIAPAGKPPVPNRSSGLPQAAAAQTMVNTGLVQRKEMPNKASSVVPKAIGSVERSNRTSSPVSKSVVPSKGTGAMTQPKPTKPAQAPAARANAVQSLKTGNGLVPSAPAERIPNGDASGGNKGGKQGSNSTGTAVSGADRGAIRRTQTSATGPLQQPSSSPVTASTALLSGKSSINADAAKPAQIGGQKKTANAVAESKVGCDSGAKAESGGSCTPNGNAAEGSKTMGAPEVCAEGGKAQIDEKNKSIGQDTAVADRTAVRPEAQSVMSGKDGKQAPGGMIGSGAPAVTSTSTVAAKSRAQTKRAKEDGDSSKDVEQMEIAETGATDATKISSVQNSRSADVCHGITEKAQSDTNAGVGNSIHGVRPGEKQQVDSSAATVIVKAAKEGLATKAKTSGDDADAGIVGSKDSEDGEKSGDKADVVMKESEAAVESSTNTVAAVGSRLKGICVKGGGGAGAAEAHDEGCEGEMRKRGLADEEEREAKRAKVGGGDVRG